MKNKWKKILAVAATVLFLQPFGVWAEDACRGIGGTGRALDCGIGGTGNSSNAGIGGTGHATNAAGIGGTGHSDGGIGGTGIVGIITGFGSVWVNGLEVQYDSKTQVKDNNASASADNLAIGQVVVIEAKGDDHQLQANKITVVEAVSGAISAVDAQNGKLTVLGQSVVVTTKTAQSDRQKGIAYKEGDYVKVSGLRMANGEIIASRIVRSEPVDESGVVGPITKVEGKTAEIYGLKIDVPTDVTLSMGQEVTVTGKLVDGVLSVKEFSLSPSAQLYGQTEHVNLQGYVAAVSPEGKVKIGGLEVEISSSSLASENKVTAGDLVQVSGHFVDGHRVIAERIEFSRDQIERVQLDRAGNERGGAESMERAERGDRLERPDKPEYTDHSGVSSGNTEHNH